MKLILVGPPGCGKGTQAVRICSHFGIPHISTGDIIRAEIKADSELGKKAKAIIEKGELLDDETILKMIKERLGSCPDGYLFDGFPRTIAQAKDLDEIDTVDLVIHIKVPDELVIKRISSRWMVDAEEGQNIFNNEKEANEYAEKHNGKAYQREDDKEETIRERLKVYHEQTEPIIEYYTLQGLIETVDGDNNLEDVWHDIHALLKQKI